MNAIEAYRCFDGSLHTDEQRAERHDEQLLSAELDGLIKLIDANRTVVGYPERTITKLLASSEKRQQLQTALTVLAAMFAHAQKVERDGAWVWIQHAKILGMST